MRDLAVLLALFVVSASCARTQDGAGSAFVTASGPLAGGAAQVCVVRPDRTGHEASMPLRDNGRLVGATRGATFSCWLAAPGEHQITSVDDDTGPMLLQARAGARYWLHQDVAELGGAVHAHLDWVDEASARAMIDECDDRVRVAVPGHEDEPAAMAIAPARRAR